MKEINIDENWFAFTELVRTSKSQKELQLRRSYERIKLSGQTPFNPPSTWSVLRINEIPIYNPIASDYIDNNIACFEVFRKGHKKGLKYFKKTYSVKLPTNKQIQMISDKYNNVWKDNMRSFNMVWNDNVIKVAGFENGILEGYTDFENAYQKEFGDYLKPFENIEHKKETKGIEAYFFNLQDKSKFLFDLKQTFKTEIGIDFSILIHLLKDSDLLIIGNREFKGFHKLCKDFFYRDIGSIQGITDTYKHSKEDQKIYKQNIASIKNNLNPLILKHKNQFL